MPGVSVVDGTRVVDNPLVDGTAVDIRVADGTAVDIRVADGTAVDIPMADGMVDGIADGLADGMADGAMGGDPGSIGEVQSWDGRISILIIIPILILIPIPIMHPRQQLSSSNLRRIANKNSKNPITGITAKIRKVTTRMSKVARGVG